MQSWEETGHQWMETPYAIYTNYKEHQQMPQREYIQKDSIRMQTSFAIIALACRCDLCEQTHSILSTMQSRISHHGCFVEKEGYYESLRRKNDHENRTASGEPCHNHNFQFLAKMLNFITFRMFIIWSIASWALRRIFKCWFHDMLGMHIDSQLTSTRLVRTLHHEVTGLHNDENRYMVNIRFFTKVQVLSKATQ